MPRTFKLEPGDIAIETASFPHSLIVLEEIGPEGCKVAHATPENSGKIGVYIEDKEQGPEAGAPYFRIQGNKNAATLAAQFARSWATFSPSTPYGYQKIQDKEKTGKEDVVLAGRYFATWNNRVTSTSSPNPPFGFDALFRVIKWASRAEAAAFSKNQGTTCAAFVTACYQSALLIEAALRPELKQNKDQIQTKLKELLSDLEKTRGPKKNSWEQMKALPPKEAFTETPKGKPISARSQIEHSNRGSSLTLEEAWKLVAAKLGLGQKTIEEVFTPGMLVDAKYAYSQNIINRLTDDKAHWSLAGVQP